MKKNEREKMMDTHGSRKWWRMARLPNLGEVHLFADRGWCPQEPERTNDSWQPTAYYYSTFSSLTGKPDHFDFLVASLLQDIPVFITLVLLVLLLSSFPPPPSSPYLPQSSWHPIPADLYFYSPCEFFPIDESPSSTYSSQFSVIFFFL